jgi:hypothetical protein
MLRHGPHTASPRAWTAKPPFVKDEVEPVAVALPTMMTLEAIPVASGKASATSAHAVSRVRESALESSPKSTISRRSSNDAAAVNGEARRASAPSPAVPPLFPAGATTSMRSSRSAEAIRQFRVSIARSSLE